MPAKWEKMLAVLGQFSFFFIKINMHKEDPCARDLLLDGSKLFDISITHYFLSFSFLFSRFLYDGSRIQDDDTPASLDMEDNGMFKVLFHVLNH